MGDWIVMEWINGYMSTLVEVLKKFADWCSDVVIQWAEITVAFFVALIAFSVVATLVLFWFDITGGISIADAFKSFAAQGGGR